MERVGLRPQFGIRQGRVGGAEVNPDDVLRFQIFHSISISAGAMIDASCLGLSGGRSILAARQPLCRKTPPGGVPAGTLPINFTTAESPAGVLVYVPSTPSITG